jgi:hypothetical protein
MRYGKQHFSGSPVIRRNVHERTLPRDVVFVSLLGILAAEDFAYAAHVAVRYTGIFGIDE